MHPEDRVLLSVLGVRQEGDTSWNAFEAARAAYRARLAEMAAEHRAAMLYGPVAEGEPEAA
ncbi:MAG: hypothetical protein IT200_14405 [Thermoleophilia bacterium]|nr:hypothetical protein [Thermoleophilia bacterium]